MIRTLMVSTSYPASAADWRGLFIRHLTEGLARRSDLTLRVWCPPGETPPNVEYATNSKDSAWLAGLMAAGGVSHLMRQGGIRGLISPIRLLAMSRAMYRRTTAVDVYHVNWLQNALTLPASRRPLLMTVLGNDIQLLRLPGMQALMRRVCRGRRVAICPNADWMVPILEAAFGNLAHVRTVPFGIDPAWFDVKRSLSDATPQRWLCVTRLTAAKLGPLFEWCQPHFADGARQLHLFGPAQEAVQVPQWVRYHGPATPEALCNEWFPQAQGLITLSRHAEGRPQVIMEAMAAGLPIIASRLAAHTDLICDGLSGHICDSAEDVGRALDNLGDTDVNRLMGTNGRTKVASEIGTWDDCAGRYAAIYHELLGQHAP